MYIIGIDIGSTITKVIQVNNNRIINKEIYNEKNIYEIVNNFIKDKHIDISEIKKFVITGIRALDIKEKVYNISTQVISELDAIANCVQENKCLIASIGTGTAFILKGEKENIHWGGTGLGGGTLINLSEKVTGIKEFQEIKEALKKGNINNVDLKLKNISKQNFSNLNMDTTISNFGKIEKEATNEDLIFGILNMIIESIAVMAAMAIKNTKIKDVFVIGTITSLPEIEDILKRVSEIHNINFKIPENSEFLTVLGAIETAI